MFANNLYVNYNIDYAIKIYLNGFYTNLLWFLDNFNCNC